MAIRAVFFHKLKKVLESHKRLQHWMKKKCLAIIKYFQKWFWFSTSSLSHYRTAGSWNRNYSSPVNSVLAVKGCNWSVPASDPALIRLHTLSCSCTGTWVTGFDTDASECRASQRCKAANGAFLITGKSYNPGVSVVIEVCQHLTDWEEGKACKIFFICGAHFWTKRSNFDLTYTNGKSNQFCWCQWHPSMS